MDTTILILKLFLICWFWVEFAPIQDVLKLYVKPQLNKLIGCSETRRKIINAINDGMSCQKCTSLWVALIVTQSIWIALAVSYLAYLTSMIIYK